MPTQTYDPDADKQHNPSADIRSAEEHASRQQHDPRFDDIVKNYDKTAEHPLGKRETEATSNTTTTEDKKSEDKVGKGYTGGVTANSTKRQDLRAIGKGLRSKKWLIAGAGGGVLGTVGIIVLLTLLASSLGISNLAQNITNYEFARMGRQFSESARGVTDESLAVEGASDGQYSKWKSTYEKATKPIKDTWSKLDKYRPAKVQANMLGSGDLKFNYGKTDILGRPKLTSITLKGVDYPIIEQGGTRFVPGLGSIIKFKNNVTFSSTFQPALNEALRADDIGPVIRGAVAKSLREKLGINLIAWTLSKFKDKNASAAQIEETRERVTAIDEQGAANVPNNAATDKLKQGIDAAQQAEQQVLGSDTSVQAVIKSGGIASTVQAALINAVKSNGFDTAIGIANPAYGAMLGMCIVYDGSLNSSGPTIDKQATQQQSAFYYITTAASQQQRGALSTDPSESTELASAVNATNADIASTTSNNAQVRASGYNIDTSGTLSAEQSAGGQYTLLDATIGSLGIPGAGLIAGTIDAIGNSVCPVVTNTYVAVGGAIINIGIGIISLGSSATAEEVAGEAATQIVNTEAKSLAESLVTKYIGKTAGRITGLLYDTGKGTVKSGIKIAAATVLAKLIVNSRSGQAFSGFAQGADLANQADAGGNLQANELERTQLFGRPMAMNEVCASNQDDRAYLAANFSKQSTYDRYLNAHNANSLLSHTAVAVSTSFNGSLGKSLVTLGGALLRPLSSFGILANMFTGVSHAASNCNSDSAEYGNVQFGWSQDEENLIASDASYKPLENQQILDDSGQEDAIAQKYATCFGYTYNSSGDGSLDPGDTGGNLTIGTGPGEDASIGTLLSGGKIVRDTHGNVLDKGLCSPSNLGYNSSDSLGNDSSTDSSKAQDLIFRWRLAMRYDTTLNQLSAVQNAPATSL